MSFDLAFWYASSAPSAEEADRIYDQLTDGLDGVVDKNPAIGAFYRSVVEAFPDLTEENMHQSPWASGLYVTEECVVATISWSRSDEVAAVLLDLAEKHGLTAYDPQNRVVSGGDRLGDQRP